MRSSCTSTEHISLGSGRREHTHLTPVVVLWTGSVFPRYALIDSPYLSGRSKPGKSRLERQTDVMPELVPLIVLRVERDEG